MKPTEIIQVLTDLRTSAAITDEQKAAIGAAVVIISKADQDTAVSEPIPAGEGRSAPDADAAADTDGSVAAPADQAASETASTDGAEPAAPVAAADAPAA